MPQDTLFTTVTKIALVAVAAALLGACSGGGNAVAPMNRPPTSGGGGGAAGVLSTRMLKGGPGFVTASGFTVYVFDLDLTNPGHSSCNGPCAQNWPPVAPPAGATLDGQFATITRSDGSSQLTYAGRPLYTFIADSAPGQANGDGLNAFGGVWHIARPQSMPASPTPMPSGGGGGGGY
jgi:predicted lipoprotein with Yx(FWY)xxD motif